MSASIENGPNSSEEDSREVLSAWLDDYIAGRCDRGKMHESFLEVCRSNPEAPWDALALLDQYQRRGRVDVGLARSLKAEIAQLVFGVATQTEEPADAEATLDATGSRWRKLYAERGSLNAEDVPVEDPATRALGPMTRPPPLTRPSATQAPPSRDAGAPRTEAREARETTAPKAQHRTEVRVGTILRDRYELMEVIATERAGTVYHAFDRHRSHLPSPQCYVAIRVLDLPREGRETALAAIEHEAYQAQSLSHPNIASVFDLDRHHDVYFVVMELLEGELLSEVMQRLAGKPMSRERTLAVVNAVGAALLHAHRRNIAHGDLKPAAIVLTTNGEVKVLNFGFARSHEFNAWTAAEPSIDGADAQTTSAYASAERVAGEEPHPRDDVYSLACIAYELLTGRHPYGGRSAAFARTNRPPQKISGLSARQWQAFRTALEGKRADRRIDVAEFLAVLGGAEGIQPVAPMPASRQSLDNPFGRGKGVILAVLLVAGAGAGAWWQLPRFIEPQSVSPVAGHSEEVASTDVAPAPAAPAEAISEPETTTAAPAPVAEPVQPPAEEAPKPPTGAIVAATADPPPDTAAGGNEAAAAQQPSAKAKDEGASAQSAREQSATTAAASRTSTVEFDKDTYVATESDAMVTLTVRRNGGTRSAAKFRWVLRPNSAEAGSDYAGIGPGIEEIPPGRRTATITVPLVSDGIAENTELFLVELEPLEGGPDIGEQGHAAVILVDDD